MDVWIYALFLGFLCLIAGSIMLAVDIMFRGFENFVAKRFLASRIWSIATVLLIAIGTILVVLYKLDLPHSAAFPGKPF